MATTSRMLDVFLRELHLMWLDVVNSQATLHICPSCLSSAHSIRKSCW